MIRTHDYPLRAVHLRSALDVLAERDQDLAATLKVVGYPPERRRPVGFASLLRIIVAQQLSAKAAASIAARIDAAMGGSLEPAAFLALDEARLRVLGLSRQKIAYARALAEAVIDGAFDPKGLAALDDEAVVQAITAHKGFGVWSARMYLIFSLGRPDVWPADDLGVREAVRRIKGLTRRPTVAETEALGEAWSPHRSAVALLCWHALHNSST